MATVSAVIIKNEQKKDGTWNVKIRVSQRSVSAYIPTSHFVISKQIRKDFTIKDTFIIDTIAPVLAEYRRLIGSLGLRGEMMTAKEITQRLKASHESKDANFSRFMNEHIEELTHAGKLSSADNFKTVRNSLHDYFQGSTIMASDINFKMLKAYEKFLTQPRRITRKDQYGKSVTRTLPGVTSGLHNYMRDLRVLFNAARDKYNDMDNGILKIPHYPFAKYKVVSPPAPKKRNLTIDQIRMIRDASVQPGSRAELARDVFMLSFYLCGMNAVDLYQLTTLNNGRVEYQRSKTTGRRKDRAFISIKAADLALPLLNKYMGKISSQYACSDNLNSALNKGLKDVGTLVNIDGLTFYHARHSFGSIARNVCRFSKDDVALAMNHIDQSRRTTDAYIAPNWSIIDELQSSVIALLTP